MKSLRKMKRLKGVLRERRREARRPLGREAQLVAGLSFPGADDEWRSFVGHAADLSESGLSLTVKDERFGCGLVAAPGCVRITLALPSATINFRASVAYCKAADERRPGSGHVVGLRIDEIGGDERRRLKAYLDSEPG